MLLVTVPAVNWSTFCWLERNFRLLTTVRTDDFVHCSGTTIRPTTHRPSTPPIIRDTLPVPLLGYRPPESTTLGDSALNRRSKAVQPERPPCRFRASPTSQ